MATKSENKLNVMDRDVFISLCAIAKDSLEKVHSVKIDQLCKMSCKALSDRESIIASLKRLAQTQIEIGDEPYQFRDTLLQQLEVDTNDTVTFTLGRVPGGRTRHIVGQRYPNSHT